jgi:Holliday junction resolvase
VLTPDEISRLAFLLYPNIVRTKPDTTSTESLAARVKSLESGLLPEDEFIATVCWLGNCTSVHRIDQTPYPLPTTTEEMQAPDLLAFPIVNNKPFPVLIEVKSRHDTRLKWSEKYLNSLRRFAECLGIPLLIAWKCGSLWSVVDHRHFEKNVTAYQLTLGKALTEDLYCVLFRNLRIQMNPELEFILGMEILDDVPGDPQALLPEASYHTKIISAGFYRDAEEVKGYPPAHLALFMSAPDDSEVRRTGKQSFQQVIRPLEDSSFTLSNVFFTELSLSTEAEAIDWHSVLAAESFKSSGPEFVKSLDAGIKNGFIRYVMDIIPNTWPDFLPKDLKPGSAT